LKARKCFFIAKKEAQKLLFAEGVGTCRATTRNKQKFFGSFFQKRTASFPLQTSLSAPEWIVSITSSSALAAPAACSPTG
jgi:hypothetical protein